MTRARFQAYIASRDSDREFPGAHGFGFIRKVAPEQETAFAAAVKADGRDDFRIKQLTPHDGEKLVIQYIEPETINAQAIGLDIASEQRRREAAETAMRDGVATLTKPITLVQALGKVRQGFLFLLPVYRWHGSAPPTQELRRQFSVGLVYTPLVIDEVLADFDFRGGEFSLTLADASDAELSERFFASPGAEAEDTNNLVKQIRLPVFGRAWLVEVKARPLFINNLNQTDPWRIVGGMLVIAALLSVLLYVSQVTKLRRRQFRLEQARLAAIVANSSDAIVGTTLDGTVTSWNKAAELTFGYIAEQACGQRLVDLVVPEALRDQEASLLTRIIQGETIPHFNTRRRQHDGGLIDASVTISPIYDASGRVVGTAETIRDISRQQAAEARIRDLNNTLEMQVIQRTAELELARHDLQTVLDAVPSMIGYWDRNLINQFANQAYFHWFGIEPQQIKGMAISDLMGAELYGLNRPHIEAALNGERQVFERSIPSSDGSGLRHSQTQYLPDWVDGGVRGFYVIAHDVTEIAESRRKLAEALRENELLSRAINEQLLISITDRAGRISEVNDNFCRLSGYSREELLGQNHRMVNSGLHPRDFWNTMWRTISGGKAWRAEVCNRAKDGSLYWVDNMIAPIREPNGGIDRYISVRTDITDKKHADAELARVNGMLAGVMSASTRVSIISTDRDGVIQLFNSGVEHMLMTWTPPHPMAVSQCTREYKRDKEESEMNRNVVGLDIAKQVFHLFMMLDGKAVKRKLKRSELLTFIAQLPPSLIALEACGGSHHWARSFQQLGHEAILLNARYVKAFVVGNKNDFNDAEAIFTAARQPNKRTVAIKDIEQQDLTMVHGIRQGKVEERTALINRIRGHLAERGIVLPKSANQVRKQLPSILEDAENQLSTLSRALFAEQYQALVAMDAAIKAVDRRIDALCRQNTLSKRLIAIPGIGPLTATLAAADVGDGKGYTSSRDYAASLGVVPRQHSSGDRQVLLGIYPRGTRASAAIDAYAPR